MKIKYILLFGAMAALGSCSTAYRSGQTPDDVYYSPAPEQNSYVSEATENDKDSYYNRNNQEENDIRRGIQDPVYRNSISFNMGISGGYIPYSFSLFPYTAFNNPLYYPYGYNYHDFGYDPFTPYAYNPFGYSHSFVYNDMIFNAYSPYGHSYYPYGSGYGYGYSPYNIYSPGYYLPIEKVNTNTGVRRYNLNAYNNGSNGGEGNPTGISRGTSMPVRTMTTGTRAPIRSATTESTPVRRTGVGQVIRRVFTPSENRSYNRPNNNNRTYRSSDDNRSYNNNNNNNRTENQTPVRSYTPSESSQSSSGNNNNSAPVRTFRR